jgi:hypothetical protein
MDALRNLGLIFTSPSQAAAQVADRPHWVLPLVILMVVAAVFTLSTFKYQLQEQRQTIEEMLEERGMEMDEENMPEDSTAGRVLGGAGAAVMAGLAVLVGAAILNGFATLMGHEIGFRKMFAFYSHVGLIGALGMLVKIPIVLAKQDMDVRTSVLAFAPSIPLDSLAGVFLSNLDLFSIWSVVATVVGYDVLSGMGRRKSAYVVVGLWVLWMLVSVALYALRNRVIGG